MQAGVVLAPGVDGPVGVAHAQHDGLLALVDDEEAVAGQHDGDGQQAQQNPRQVAFHWPPPGVVASTVGPCFRPPSAGGTRGMDAPRASMTTLFEWARMRSMVSM